MRVVWTIVVVAAIILGLVATIIAISYGYHRMTNPSYSPRKSPTITRATTMPVRRTAYL